MDYKEKLRNYLIKEMDKLPTHTYLEKEASPFGFCFTQAKFDVLMNIDLDLELNAFIKSEE